MNKYQQNKQLGFTIIELVITIILLGILAAYAVPRFTGANAGFESYGVRSEAIVKLRAIQLRAMQNTRAQTCVFITAQRLGIPANCDTPALPNNLRVTSTSMVLDGVSRFSFSSGSSQTIHFDRLGRPTDSSGALLCQPTCTISISGEPNLNIFIESQGYIHD